jgi:predicted SnoaL-like aldol condensation-catalyzing enzyme
MAQKTKDRNQLFGLVARTALPPLLLCALPFDSRTASPGPDPSSNRKTQVVDLLKSLETGDTTAARVINSDRYTQHDPRVSDGLAEFLDAVKRLSTNSAKVHTVRAFLEDIFIERDMTKLGRYFDGNNYINHNPRIADGVDHPRARLLSTTRTHFGLTVRTCP